MMAAFLKPGLLSAVLALWVLGSGAAQASQTASPAQPAAAPVAQPIFADAATEERLRNLSKELRCVVCQNEALSDSPADLADSMRQEIRGLIREGKTDQEVIEFLTARYGDFVLFRPPFKPLTYLLWIGPFVFLAFGAVVWYLALRARRTFRSAPVSGEQIATAARLLEEKT
ncbi:MAG: cytochrome c-type biogenesis protein CcmH [Serpentinimonas sp.]|nr:cytochrome c-type biogenesis protein CcmH [Serpentinimonas sp.]